ncbi:MAG: 3-deoxy-manno-octulosonate cytidylyltransferase [Prolixibacteraceae bacterium]|nr:3-deoxy-manno-octulosonate cytidylyltransferase [Prolixibacteraceae bacterium]
MTTKFIAIIPSRFGSSRFPGKPLADIAGKPMIQRVYEQVIQAEEEAWVATDDERIASTIRAFGGKVVMTSADHRSGTDRCAEAVRKISRETGIHFDVVINIQGDEPFISPEQISILKQPFLMEASTGIATLIQQIHRKEVLFNHAEVKVALDIHGNALYFSRLPIPMVFKSEESDWLKKFTYYCHVGIYAYRTDILEKLSALPEGLLEQAESLEQLRWLENGYTIKTVVTDHATVGIDTPEELEIIVAEGIDKYYSKR